MHANTRPAYRHSDCPFCLCDADKDADIEWWGRRNTNPHICDGNADEQHHLHSRDDDAGRK